MLKVALTGGIACGKSLAGEYMREAGAEVIDADPLAHEAIRKGQPAYQEVVDAFGTGILDASGEIDRRTLGSRVFSDPEGLERLNGIVHPRVNAAWRARLVEREAGGCALAVVMIPLLFEAGLEQGWDAVVCVSASPAVQMARLENRGLTALESEQRVAAQLPLHQKAEPSDYVVDNSGTEEQLREQILQIVGKLAEKRHDGT